MTVRVGILGCGAIARAAHLPSLASVPDARVVALSDPDGTNLTTAQSLVRHARAVGDYRDVIAMTDVDAVVVALPPALHADATIAALQHGKHVYVEKPLATTLADGVRVVAAARATSLTAMMGFNYRFHSIVQSARDCIAGGGIGAPVAVRTVFATPARAIAPWKARRRDGGGALLDLGVHHVDLLRFLLGAEVTAVSADIQSIRTEHDTAFLHSRLTCGCSAASMFALSSVDEDLIEVYGSKAKLAIDRYDSFRVEVSPPIARGALAYAAARLAGELAELPYAARKRRAPMHDLSFPAAMHAFIRAVRDRAPASPSLDDGLCALAVIDAAESSARLGRVVGIDGDGAGSR